MASLKSPDFPLRTLLLLAALFYLNFVSRIILAPLLPVVQAELGIGYGQAGSLFFFMAFGYGVGLLSSGLVSSLLTHRFTIALAGMMGGVCLILISRSSSIGGIHTGLVFIGIFAGFYLPSGISYLTDLVSQENWGRAISIHELAPNLAFVTTPFLAEFLLKFLRWRGGLEVLGVGAILFPIFFLLFGRGSKKRGEFPRLQSIREILSNPSFWTMGIFFLISVGCSFGIYTMMPLFLVSGLGMERPWANTLTGISRTFGIVALFVCGLIIDRTGPKKAMTLFLIATGAFTLLLGLFRHPTLIPILVFLQAASVACLFPTGFTLVSLIFPDRLRGMAVSLVLFMGFIMGAGIVPSAIGYWAEVFSFSSGFALIGGVTLILTPLFLRIGSRLNISN